MTGIDDLASHIFEQKYQHTCVNLCRDKIREFSWELLTILFPQMGMKAFTQHSHMLEALVRCRDDLNQLIKCLKIHQNHPELGQADIDERFFASLIEIEHTLMADAEFIKQEDPAAKSLDEVIMCYPGFRAIAIYRLAHQFHLLGLPLLPRALTEFAHELTGIDIHPGAKIDSPFFIDHGTGIVIGETTEIRRYVKLFQGVTLGALSVGKEQKNKKRHPTIEEGVVIYSNASILGGETIIGEYSTIGGNVWLTESVPAQSMVLHQNKYKVMRRNQ